MIDAETLGKRIKYFRKRAGMSQLELETSIDASAGMISRIEKGKVNPSKETVQKISEICKLSPLELDYLIGRIATPASEDSINASYSRIKDHLDKLSVFAYFTDERWRIFYFSKGFVKLMGASDEMVKNLHGKTIIEMILDRSLGIMDLFSEDEYVQILETQLAHYKREVSYMVDDPYYLRSLELIHNDPRALEYWRSLENQELEVFHTLEKRVIYFDVKGIRFGMNYSRERLFDDVRFEIIEYLPANKYLRVVQKLLQGGND